MSEPNYDRLVEIVRTTSDPTRLRLLGLIAESPRTSKELAEAVAVPLPATMRQIDQLLRAGLVRIETVADRKQYTLDLDALSALARTNATQQPDQSAGSDSEDPERAKVIRDFFDGQQLKQIPAQRKKKLVVLAHLRDRFEPGREYPEREVNDLLRTANEDFATLRRDLVDFGFMTRENGVYRVAEEK